MRIFEHYIAKLKADGEGSDISEDSERGGESATMSSITLQKPKLLPTLIAGSDVKK